VTITNIKDEKLRDAGEKLYADLQAAGLEYCSTIAMNAPG
jgi:hypothetical protein